MGSMVIDGELVVLKNGVPDFNLLQKREQSGRPDRIRLLSETLPATYITFDLLYLNGKSLLNTPLVIRRENLIKNLPEGLILSEDFKEGKKLFQKALRLGFEGIMAKEKTSPYLMGRRSSYWLKIKKSNEIDAVICGYTEGEGSREGLFGSLLLGVYDGRVLRYIGRVGSGFDIETISEILSLIKPSERALFKEPIEIDRKFRWTSPEIVCRVRYQEITKDGLLRAGVFKGLRLDKSPKECDLSQLTGLL
jgi:DNA ligase D-like protein (predicted ligase)